MLQFGDFQFDSLQQRLYGPSGEVPLKPRARAALACLLRRPGEIVSKEALVEEAWRNAAVSDEAITQRIMDIRRALADEPKAPKYIKTHPCLGYEFIATVREELEPCPASAAPAPARRRFAAGWWVAAVLVLLGVAAGPVLWLRRAVPAASSPRLDRLTSAPSLEERAVPMPGSGAAVYTSWESGTPHLYRLDLASGRSVRVTDGAGETEPDVSPDGRWLAYRSWAGTGSLAAQPLDGGNPIEIAAFGHNPRWSQQGQEVVFQPESREDALYVWRLGERVPRRIALGEPRAHGASWPVWSPDGREIYFVAGALAHDRMDEGLAGDFKGHQVWRTGRDGGTPVLVTAGFGIQDSGFDIDWARRRLLFIGLDECLMESPLSGTAGAVAGAPLRLTASTERHAYPRAGAGGSVLVSAIPYGTAFWQVTPGDGVDQARLERLTDDSLRANSPALSPGGTLLAFVAWEGERIGVWAMDFASRKRWRLSAADAYARSNVSWLDDATLLYWRIGDSGRQRVRAVLAPDRSRILSETAGDSPANPPASSGTRACRAEIAVRPGVSTLTVHAAGASRPVLTVPHRLSDPVCLESAGRVFFLRAEGTAQELWSVPLPGGRYAGSGPRRVLALPAGQEASAVRSGPGGTLLLSMHPRAGDVWMLSRR